MACNALCPKTPCRIMAHHGVKVWPCPHCGSPVDPMTKGPKNPHGERYTVDDLTHAVGGFCRNPRCNKYFIPENLPAELRAAAEPWELESTDARLARKARTVDEMVTDLRPRMRQWKRAA